ncbi:MAG: LysR substrate-binding domain-containing protein [Pseudomonadota bacterium]|nr:LysR substrate-binding domain-containing protein [Pseudomonadota bacterium]
MDVRQLRYFVEIVEAKSFTRAADRVRVAQPALGLQIRKLEDELGVPLLHRHSRGVVPTEAGAVLMGHANAILKQVEQAREEVTDLSGPPRGEIALGITPTASALLAVPLVNACRESYPDISLNLFEGLSEEIMRRLDENSLDMGFTYNTDIVSGIPTQPLLTEELYLVSTADTDTEAIPVPFATVCMKNLILPSRGFGLRELLEDLARDREVTLDVSFEIDSVATTRDLVEAGFGSTVLPFAAVQQSVEAGRLLASQIIRPRVHRILNFAYSSSHRENNASRAVRALIDYVVLECIDSSGGKLQNA